MFTLPHFRKVSPEEASPMNSLISRAMENFGKGLQLSYIPQEKEAEIFAKELGPVAQLSASPTFRGFSPQTQQMITHYINQHFGGKQGEGADAEPENPVPGYPKGNDIYDRLENHANYVLGPGGQSKVGKSNLAVAATKWNLPDFIANFLGGHKGADTDQLFKQDLLDAAQDLRLRGYPEDYIRKATEITPGTSAKALLSKLKPLFIANNGQYPKYQKQNMPNQETPPKSVDEKVAKDNKSRKAAEDTAKAFGGSPEDVLEAQANGIKTASEYKKFLKWKYPSPGEVNG